MQTPHALLLLEELLQGCYSTLFLCLVSVSGWHVASVGKAGSHDLLATLLTWAVGRGQGGTKLWDLGGHGQRQL